MDKPEWVNGICISCKKEFLFWHELKYLVCNECSRPKNIEVLDDQIKSLLADNKRLREALSHPDIEELDCDCGYFEGDTNETIEHRCIKHFAELALADTDKE